MSRLAELEQYLFTQVDLDVVEKYLDVWKTAKRSERTPIAHKVYKKIRALDKNMSRATMKQKKQVSVESLKTVVIH